MKRSTAVVAVLVLLATGIVAAAFSPACQAQAKITSLSRSEGKVGARVTIKGRGFGNRQGRSYVTFGERRVSTPSPTGNKRWAPCAKKARVISWSRSSITVRVPSMAPGTHKAYVTVGGRASNSRQFSISPAVVVRGRTFSSASSLGNVMGDSSPGSDLRAYTHNVLFDGCTFEATNPNILGDQAGVLTLGRAAKNYNLTFRNCTFKRNVGPGSGGSGWGGVNGVKSIYGVHDITFERCTFEEFSRFSVEVWSSGDPGRRPYNFAFYDCTFEPAGSQCISWSGGRNPLDSLVSGCVFKGYGTLEDGPNGACMEFARSHHIVIRGCEIWTGNGGALNVNGFQTGRPSYLFFKGVRVFFDSAHLYQSKRPHIYSSVLGCDGMSYSRWVDCRFNTGDKRVCADAVGYTGENGHPTAWARTNTHNDFRSSTICGYISHRGLHIPSTAKGYWTSGNGGPHRSNKLPKRVRTQP